MPIIDVVTRWNSTYDMLIRAVEIKDCISATFFRLEDKKIVNLLLSDSDWESVQQLIDVLEPLKEATLLASKIEDSLIWQMLVLLEEQQVVSWDPSSQGCNILDLHFAWFAS